jgi:hypothetical protein
MQLPFAVYVDDVNALGGDLKGILGDTVLVLADSTHIARRYCDTLLAAHPARGEQNEL